MTNGQTIVPVRIEEFRFVPQNITVVIGVNNTVEWTNFGSSLYVHTATSETGIWDSGILMSGQSFSFTFNQEGTYTYFCKPHPFMRGKVIVLSQGGNTTSTTSTTSTTTTTTLPQTSTTTITVLQTTTSTSTTATSPSGTTTTLPSTTTTIPAPSGGLAPVPIGLGVAVLVAIGLVVYWLVGRRRTT